MTVLSATFCFLAGLALGGLFFGGLWLTTLRIPSTGHPGRLLFASFLLRITVAGVGFYLLLRHGVACLLVGLLGFIAVRFLMVSRGLTRRTPDQTSGGED